MRIERDALGEMEVPDEAYYGSQTQRAIENFPISGIKPHRQMIRAIGLVKLAAAETNMSLGVLPMRVGESIAEAAKEVAEGKWNDQFVVDVFQAGAGTSFNMNANEVIANRALELLGRPRGDYGAIHPNDDVNASQSTNDVFPTVMRIAALTLIHDLLVPKLMRLEEDLRAKSVEFDKIVKSGRTHLQDAVPIRLGQEFSGYAEAVLHGIESISESARYLHRLNIGATAVGTGINSHPEYRERVVRRLRELTGLPLKPAENLFEVTQSMADFARVSSALRGVALELIRISGDLRLLSSGPRTGLAEINLPAVQPGSSIMPGKVNPSIAEMVSMVCFQVVGNDLAIAMATQAGQLELNVMMPVIAHNLLQSVEILGNAAKVFSQKCVRGITANEAKCKEYAEKSVALVTALSPKIGYVKAAEIAKESIKTGKGLLEVARQRLDLPEDELKKVLEPIHLTYPSNGGVAGNSEHITKVGN
ncbi:MAG: aspartate ammonia-lyase [Armatimonadota bacterium]|nr:aspartate ammonia-lyase [Armatimonadota bacterium]